MFYIYILYSQSLRRYYVGSTENVMRRLQEHNAGKSKYTRAGTPWESVHTEPFGTRA
ncbi:MAG: GIY-YIG nuclease family protein, partial [Chloroflexi bacterium]|nr:GIY-YIG nuclease family protein [Chloroflexota bacterium]